MRLMYGTPPMPDSEREKAFEELEKNVAQAVERFGPPVVRVDEIPRLLQEHARLASECERLKEELKQCATERDDAMVKVRELVPRLERDNADLLNAATEANRKRDEADREIHRLEVALSSQLSRVTSLEFGESVAKHFWEQFTNDEPHTRGDGFSATMRNHGGGYRYFQIAIERALKDCGPVRRGGAFYWEHTCPVRLRCEGRLMVAVGAACGLCGAEDSTGSGSAAPTAEASGSSPEQPEPRRVTRHFACMACGAVLLTDPGRAPDRIEGCGFCPTRTSGELLKWLEGTAPAPVSDEELQAQVWDQAADSADNWSKGHGLPDSARQTFRDFAASLRVHAADLRRKASADG